MAWVLPTALLAGVAAIVDAAAGVAAPLEPIRSEVAVRLEAGGLSRRASRALKHAARRLAVDDASVVADLRALRAVARPLEHALPGDPTFPVLLDSALVELRAGTLGERDALATWTGRLDDPREEERLADRLARFDRRVAAVDATGDRRRRAHRLARACRTVERFARRRNLELPAPAAGALPAFSLADQSATSPTGGRQVSPRDLQGLVSAWYFGHAT